VLEVVESARDGWQSAPEIIAALNLKDGSVVADIGSGVGYFALKLAPTVGSKGKVFAEDVLKEPLAFLWIRARLRHQSNLHIIRGASDNPRLPEGTFDVILIANTYHEFRHPSRILNHTFEALRPGGRLVIVDRGPLSAEAQSREIEAQHHELTSAAVESELRETGFDVIDIQDQFIAHSAVERLGDRPDNHPWWIIVARRPIQSSRPPQ